MRKFLSIMACLLAFSALHAQSPVVITLTGVVSGVEDGRTLPLQGAVILLQPSGLYAVTDEKGRYTFDKLAGGTYTMEVKMIGYVDFEKEVRLSKPEENIAITLTEQTFRLEEVCVTAQKSKAGEATASLISRQAIDHAQTSSLHDIMQLLPGAEMTNPSLASTQSITLRTASESDMNSLGTAIIVDGAPLSNNANMEAFGSSANGVSSSAAGTSTGSMGSVPNSGVDVRGISTDNIESVEVIRGIPSVQYGDLTSGAVIINSKAGAEPLNVRLKTDPKIIQAAASKGFRLKRLGSIHVSGDYAYSNNKVTESYSNYQRANLKGMWSVSLGKFSLNTSLSFNYGKDTRNPNPDDQRTMLATGSTGLGYRLAVNGNWNINAGWLKTIRFDVSNSLSAKDSYKEQLLSNAVSLYTNNMVSGTSVSSNPGTHYYDTEGNEITSFQDASAYAKFMPYSYFSHYDFYSREWNTFAKLLANFNKSWGDTSEKILVGADFKSDGNTGQGLVFPDGTPPSHNTNTDAGYRERPLYDVPFVNQLGVFVESVTRAKILGRKMDLSAGLRYDHVAYLNALSPRINLAFEIIPGWLSIRGGYGITSKAPTSAYLYPDDAYYDHPLFNGDTPAGTVTMSTTTIFKTSNSSLQMAKNRKWEAGLDVTLFGRYKLAVTFYDELMKNGYTLSSDFSCFALLPYLTYKASGSVDAAGNPTFVKSLDAKKFFHYYTPLNNRYEHQQGVEYELDFGRFEAIRTSFFLNGAWMHTDISNAGSTYELRQKNGSTVGTNVSVYDPFTSTSHCDKFITSLRITHNIPSIGFVVTLTTQFNVWKKNWSTFINDEYPQHYISAEDGKLYDFTAEMAADPAYSYMYDVPAPSRFTVQETIPTVVFNLNLTKEIGKLLTASFYVNNLFNSRPLDPSETSPGVYTELNNPIYFGFELKLKI